MTKTTPADAADNTQWDQATPIASQVEAEDAADSNSKKSAFKKAAGALSVVTGFRYAKRNLQITKNRASMPLARQIVKDELAWQKTMVDPEQIRTELLKKTVFWQQWLFLFSLLTSIWGMLMLAKGWYWLDQTGLFTSTLLPGLAIIILSASRALTSYFVIRNCNKEIDSRPNTAGTEK